MEPALEKTDISLTTVSVEKRRRSYPSLTTAGRLFLECRAAHVVTVEPLVFLFMFSFYLMLFTSQQYFFWRYGTEALARNSSQPNASLPAGCISAEDLGNKLALDVQKSSSHLLSYVYVPGQVMCIFTAMILGPLSDTFGRKFVFYLVGAGVVLQGLVSFVIVWFELDMHLFIIGGVLSGLFGGFASILAGSFAYAADVSTPGRLRSVRLSLIEAMISVAGLISEGGAGKLLELLDCSFWPLTVIYTGSGLLMILYTAVFLPEPFSRLERLQRSEEQPKGAGRALRGLKLFFCPSSYSTWKLWASLAVLIIIVGNLVGTHIITAIFQEGLPLEWGPAMIGYYEMVAMAAHGVVTLLVLPLLVALSLPDVLIGLIGTVFSGGMNLFTGFVRTGWEMFLVGAASGMEAVVAPSVRSFMSKLVSAGDQGALFAFVASTELLASAMATAFYPNIFPVLLSHNLRPGSVYFIMAALCITPFLLLIALWMATQTWLCHRGRQCSNNEREPLLNDKRHTHTRTTSRTDAAIN